MRVGNGTIYRGGSPSVEEAVSGRFDEESFGCFQAAPENVAELRRSLLYVVVTVRGCFTMVHPPRWGVESHGL